jgi:hypothetical protein
MIVAFDFTPRTIFYVGHWAAFSRYAETMAENARRARPQVPVSRFGGRWKVGDVQIIRVPERDAASVMRGRSGPAVVVWCDDLRGYGPTTLEQIREGLRIVNLASRP